PRGEVDRPAGGVHAGGVGHRGCSLRRGCGGPRGGDGGDVAGQRRALLLGIGEGLVVADLDDAVAGPVAIAVDDVGGGIVARGGGHDRHVDGGDGGRVEA